MKIRAVAVDIDGTVTDYNRLIDFAGIRALRAVEALGIPVICATGNVAPVTKAFANFVGLSGPIVCENGGVVYANDFSRHWRHHDRRRADAAVRRLKRRGMRLTPLWSDRWRESEVALRLDADEDAVRKALDGQGFEVVTTRFALHIMEPGLDKFNGLKRALRFLPGTIRPNQVLAIGDSNNDVTMLRHCGASGCVGNGSPAAKQASHYVARRKHGAGVAEILRKYGVIPGRA